MNNPKTFKCTATNNPAAFKLMQQLYADMRKIADEKLALDRNYIETYERLALSRVNLRKTAAIQMCNAFGLPYSEDNAHAFEITYLEEHGDAFFTVLEGGGKEDEEVAPGFAKPGDLLQAPTDKKKLN